MSLSYLKKEGPDNHTTLKWA